MDIANITAITKFFEQNILDKWFTDSITLRADISEDAALAKVKLFIQDQTGNWYPALTDMSPFRDTSVLSKLMRTGFLKVIQYIFDIEIEGDYITIDELREQDSQPVIAAINSANEDLVLFLLNLQINQDTLLLKDVLPNASKSVSVLRFCSQTGMARVIDRIIQMNATEQVVPLSIFTSPDAQILDYAVVADTTDVLLSLLAMEPGYTIANIRANDCSPVYTAAKHKKYASIECLFKHIDAAGDSLSYDKDWLVSVKPRLENPDDVESVVSKACEQEAPPLPMSLVQSVDRRVIIDIPPGTRHLILDIKYAPDTEK